MSTCERSGKRQFVSKRAARLALTGQLASKRIRVFLCPYCKFFHVTKEDLHSAGRDLGGL